MAKCPNCGSTHIQLKQETRINWGGAIEGAAIFGSVGAVAGALTGNEIHFNMCLDCGTSWEASVLYKALKFLEMMMGWELDLSYEEDRELLNEFVFILERYSKEVLEEDNRFKKLINEKETLQANQAAAGCMVGCVTGLLIGGIFFVINPLLGIFVVLLCTVVGNVLGKKLNSVQVDKLERELKSLNIARERRKKNLDMKLKKSFNILKPKFDSE